MSASGSPRHNPRRRGGAYTWSRDGQIGTGCNGNVAPSVSCTSGTAQLGRRKGIHGLIGGQGGFPETGSSRQVGSIGAWGHSGEACVSAKQ